MEKTLRPDTLHERKVELPSARNMSGRLIRPERYVAAWSKYDVRNSGFEDRSSLRNSCRHTTVALIPHAFGDLIWDVCCMHMLVVRVKARRFEPLDAVSRGGRPKPIHLRNQGT